MRRILIPTRVRALRQDEAGSCDAASYGRTVDIAENILQRDQRAFWQRITRIASAERIQRVVVKSYAKCLLYVKPNADLTNSQHNLVENATNRLEAASGTKFKDSSQEDLPSAGRPRGLSSTICGWTNDEVLASTVRSTPLFACAAAEMSMLGCSTVLAMAGWRMGTRSATGLEAWKYTPLEATSSPPLVLFPGLGIGYCSFLPFALYLQAKLSKRTIVVFRWPWSECGQPLEAMPQWNCIVQGILTLLNEFSVDSVDIVAHSYGTCIANRVMRRLCDLDVEVGFPAPRDGFCYVNTLVLLEPMMFGDTSAGLSCGQFNEKGLDINLAALANRGGVPWKETMFYDPSSHGQCRAGMQIYACFGDFLMDVDSTVEFCRKYQPNARFHVDSNPNGNHGSFLIDLWRGGVLWNAPSWNCVANLLCEALDAEPRST